MYHISSSIFLLSLFMSMSSAFPDTTKQPVLSHNTKSGGYVPFDTSPCPQFDLAFRTFKKNDTHFGYFTDYIIYSHKLEQSGNSVIKSDGTIIRTTFELANINPKYAQKCKIQVEYKYVFEPVFQQER